MRSRSTTIPGIATRTPKKLVVDRVGFLMLVVVVLERAFHATDKGVAVADAAGEANAVAARIQKYDLRIRLIRIEWDSVTLLIKRVLGTEERLAGVIAEASRPGGVPCIGIRDGSEGCLVIAGALSAAIRPKQQGFRAVLDTTASSTLPVVGSARG